MKKLLLPAFFFLSLQTFAVRLHGVIRSKALCIKTERLTIVMDYELFLNAFGKECDKMERWNSDKNVKYKEDGKPYRLALKNHLDSLFLNNDSAYLDPLKPVYYLKEKAAAGFITDREMEAAVMRLMKKGDVTIIEDGRGVVKKISIRKKTYRLHILARTGQAWIIKNKTTGQEIYSQQIRRNAGAYY